VSEFVQGTPNPTDEELDAAKPDDQTRRSLATASLRNLWRAGRVAGLEEAARGLENTGDYDDASRAEAEGDYVAQAYHEGLHDAWAAVNSLIIGRLGDTG
jgi:hypothetical protein